MGKRGCNVHLGPAPISLSCCLCESKRLNNIDQTSILVQGMVQSSPPASMSDQNRVTQSLVFLFISILV